MNTHKPNYITLNSPLSPAELCRKNGWKTGTRLIGTDEYNTSIITITAVGEEKILAKYEGSIEQTWTLEYRDWRELA